MFNKYPYTDFHELNLDWFLNEFKILREGYTDIKTTVTEFTQFVLSYFDDLDAQQAIADKIQEMLTDGELQAILAEPVADAAGTWLARNLSTPSTPPVDQSLSVGNAAADAAVTGHNFRSLNAFDYFSALPKTSATHQGVAYTWDAAGLKCTCIGTATGASFNTIFQGAISGTPFEAGSSYYITVSGLGNMRLRGYFYDNADIGSATQIGSFNWSDGDGYRMTIPEGTQAMIIRIWAATGTLCNQVVSAICSKAPSNQAIVDRTIYHYGNFGTSSLANTYDSADEINISCSTFVSTTGGIPDLAGWPLKNAGWLITATVPLSISGLRWQLALPYMPETDRPVIRYRTGGSWHDWLPIGMNNKDAKMLSFGNSIYSGSVWIDGTHAYNTDYDSAAYGMIANALNIGRINVEHNVLSSTGILAIGDTNTNFHDAIMARSDYADYDVVLCHAWIRDMNSPISDIYDAVAEMADHIHSYNKACQLIVCGIPPCNTNAALSGDYVFTGLYPNGSSISQFDAYMMGKMQDDKCNFIFIPTSEMPDHYIAYRWQDFTDGANVHLNSERAYRTWGSAIAAMVKERLTF